ASFDTNQDGKIDMRDQNFQKLLVWRDLNQNGVSEKHELKSLSKYKIVELALNYTKISPIVLTEDNEIRLSASYKVSDGKSYISGDVWFKVRRSSAVAAK